MLDILSYVLGPLYVLLGEVSVQVLCPFFNWVACLLRVESCEFFIYFGDQTVVRGIIDKYIFTYGWFPIHFADVSLVVQKLFILMRSHSFILSLMCLALGDISVKILLHGIYEIFLPMFSWQTFMVSRLKFNYLEFIFVYGVSWWSSLIFLHLAVQLSQHHLLKRLFLLQFMLLTPLSITNWPYRIGFFSRLSILFYWSMCLFLCLYQAVLITVGL